MRHDMAHTCTWSSGQSFNESSSISNRPNCGQGSTEQLLTLYVGIIMKLERKKNLPVTICVGHLNKKHLPNTKGEIITSVLVTHSIAKLSHKV